MKLRDITVEHLRAYRALRLKSETRTKTVRSIATVNREMARMRMMLNIAVSNDWLVKSPFSKARHGTLITVADEVKRDRIITSGEEKSLLEACDTPARAHLHALVLAALATGARQGELLTLQWKDVDLDALTLTVTSYKAKTVQHRPISINPKLLAVLNKLRTNNPQAGVDERVFGILDNVKWLWKKARLEAGLDGLRFHDLRHTAATRLAQHMQLSEVGRVLGHSTPSTTYRYANLTNDMSRRAGEVLMNYHNESNTQKASVETVH